MDALWLGIPEDIEIRTVSKIKKKSLLDSLTVPSQVVKATLFVFWGKCWKGQRSLKGGVKFACSKYLKCVVDDVNH